MTVAHRGPIKGRGPRQRTKIGLTYMGVWRIPLLAMAVVMLCACGGPAGTTGGPSPSPTPTDVAEAERTALGLFLVDPTVPNHWVACSNSDNWAACPLADAVKQRLATLASQGFFGDAGGCGEEYLTGTQNGLDSAPAVVSATPSDDGKVSVVMSRAPSRPNLTAVMGLEGDAWLALDLASGTGPSASIFSTKPNC